MSSVVGLYLSYLKSAVLVMLWAALAFATYAFIRSSTVAEVVAAAAVSLVLSLVVALPLVDCLSPSHYVRRTVAAVFQLLLELGMLAPQVIPHPGRRHGVADRQVPPVVYLIQ